MKEQTVTIPLNDLLWIILGTPEHGVSCNPIPVSTANILSHILKDSSLYTIEQTAPLPRLWWKRDYLTAIGTQEKRRAYWDKIRNDEWIFRANVTLLAKAISNKTKVPLELAESMAYNMMKNPNAGVVIREFFGVERLFVTVEEIP